MFEYYKYKLANKSTKHSEANSNEEPVFGRLGKKVWLISILLATSLSVFIVFSPLGGIFTVISTLPVILLIFVWLMTHLKDKPIKKLLLKLAQFGAFLLISTLLMGVLYGLISVVFHLAMRETHHLGQIAMAIDLMTRGIILFLTPIMIVMFFRFVGDQKLWTKIRLKTYLELFIILALGLLLSSIPNAVVFRSLTMTYVMQFLIFILINTLLITAVITTCQNRGVLR